MPIIEIAISCEGFPLYKRIWTGHPVEIDDDDAISAALHMLFYSIEKKFIPDAQSNTVLKLDMDSHYMHMMKILLEPTPDGFSRDLYVYIIEDSNLDKRISTTFMKKVLDAFVKSYKDRIDSMLKESINLPEFDVVVDKLVSGMQKKKKKSAPEI